MPTNRSRRSRARIARHVPAWVERLKAGEPPERNSEEDDDFVGWWFFADHVVGLPSPDTAEGRKLWERRG